MKKARARIKAMSLPKVGDDVYIPTALYLSHGRDDRVGGLAKVRSVSKEMSGGKEIHFISVKEIPSRSFNWEQSLALKQNELKKEFGKQRAHPNPDYSLQFNEP